MLQRIFHINAEVKAVTNVVLDPKRIAGAAVRCLVPADTSDDAIAVLSAQLKEYGLELMETEWCVDFYSSDWENPDNDAEVELAELARSTGEVQFGTFHTWGHDAPDAP